jgi:hypothetical protein
MAMFKYVISRQNDFRDPPWHRACSSFVRGNWHVHPNHDPKVASMREAEWESAVETVTRAMQGPIQQRRFNPLTVSRVSVRPR